MSTGAKWGIGCIGFLFLLVGAGALGVWHMSKKYGMTDDPAVILERSLGILPLEFPEPLRPGWSMFTADEQRDPLVLYGVQERDSKLVVILVAFEEETELVEFSNRVHNIRRDLTPWRDVVDSGVPVVLTAAGQDYQGKIGDYEGEDGMLHTAVLVVIPRNGGSVLFAVDGKSEEVDAAYAQTLLDPLQATTGT